MVLVTQDVVTAPRSGLSSRISAHGDARNRGAQRHAGVHEGERGAPQTVAIEDEPFNSVISETRRIV